MGNQHSVKDTKKRFIMKTISLFATLLVAVALGAVSVDAGLDKVHLKRAARLQTCEKKTRVLNKKLSVLKTKIQTALSTADDAMAVDCVETGNAAADCTADCAVATATVTTAKAGTGAACAGDYTCTAGDGACPAAKKSCKCTDGTAAGIWFDTTCETDGAEDCKDCNIGYILKDQACEAAPTPPPTPAPPAKKEIGQSCSEDSECDSDSCSEIKIAASGGPCYPDPCPGGDPPFVEAYWTRNEDSKCQGGA